MNVESATPDTNFDKIVRAESPEDLIEIIGTGCFRCIYKDSCGSFNENCVTGNIEWLKQEAECDDFGR